MSEIKKAYLQEPRLYYNSYIKELQNNQAELIKSLKECISVIFHYDTVLKSAVQNDAQNLVDRLKQND